MAYKMFRFALNSSSEKRNTEKGTLLRQCDLPLFLTLRLLPGPLNPNPVVI